MIKRFAFVVSLGMAWIIGYAYGQVTTERDLMESPHWVWVPENTGLKFLKHTQPKP